ncbi:DEAD/DEAH box helicase family protein [Streptomonospora wellingtoniae]|uniref:DEAD/DEAH box helicase family protein n=1 Tax=Streptomonospora wellingtoniae TaxID=3075544 RepID=A0ABU2KW15_9ACTN|nr:DEAD/DEAH box helicase family protein [Streptomonospora sp. DSM 45055]MDT0303453.1 DEAD/DEAH box helicase family protein [Streptomonospora sp. DSM 45055]
MTAVGAASAIGRAHWGGSFRPYQSDLLERLRRRWSSGASRAWVVLPPGAGKTLVGLEAARELGSRVVVLTPNTAIQGQWISHWRAFERPDGAAAGASRALEDAVNVLTYQSLAVFDPEQENDEHGAARPLLQRLHPNGAALVEALHGAGPLTVVLDECHHLLQVWGRLLAEVLAELDDARVIGLTGTPPASLTRTESDLVGELFGEVLQGASIPALVRGGYLAPFDELAWLTEPTRVERDYLADSGLRFSELCTDLLAPGFAETGFLDWLRLRFHERTDADAGADADAGGRVAWSRLAGREPDLTDAVLRLHHAGLAPLPPEARMLERHRRPPRVADWMALLDDYVRNCLLPAADRDGGAEPVERIRAALPAVGHRLTRRGLRAGRSPVDRVLARSAAKARAAVEITAAESASLGERMRALVLCDHERAGARPSARLRGVLAEEAGSAWECLELMCGDERTRGLGPMLVTGRTLAAAPATAAGFAAWAAERLPGCAAEAQGGTGGGGANAGGTGRPVRIEGSWTPRARVRLVTEYFEQGRCGVLVGTRGMLGEGWDARRVNTVVDLTTATTPTAVVQGRGRALRTDPDWPEKTAHTWTVVCVSADHPNGDADWDRFVRKHEGYLGVDAEGEVTGGVAHVDAAFSPYAPPAAAEFDAVNARMLARAEDRADARERWRIGAPYEDLLLPTLRVTGGGSPRPLQAPSAVPAPAGIAAERPGRAAGPASLAAGAAAALAACALLLALPPAVVVALAAAAAVAAERWTARRLRVRTAARLVAEAAAVPDVERFGRAVADALAGAGHSPVGSAGMRLHVDSDGAYRLTLADGGTDAAEHFRDALDDVLSPLVGTPRYIVPRYRLDAPGDPGSERAAAAAWLDASSAPNPAVYHAVPALLARNRTGARAFARAWNRWVSAGEAHYTADSPGAGLLREHYGTDPSGLTTASRLTWC